MRITTLSPTCNSRVRANQQVHSAAINQSNQYEPAGWFSSCCDRQPGRPGSQSSWYWLASPRSSWIAHPRSWEPVKFRSSTPSTPSRRWKWHCQPVLSHSTWLAIYNKMSNFNSLGPAPLLEIIRLQSDTLSHASRINKLSRLPTLSMSSFMGNGYFQSENVTLSKTSFQPIPIRST